MKIEEIKLIYEYDYWADWRILAACEKVNPEQYFANTGYRSLHTTLVHKLDSDWGWRLAFQKYFVPLADWKQGSPAKQWEGEELTEADLPTLDALKERWRGEEKAMRGYLDSLSDEDLNGIVRYGIPGGIVRERVLWHCLIHVANHGTQHRSEAAEMLTRYGQSPGEVDFTAFLNHFFKLQIEE
jgi:uncharacterized damage-inducible protein DinB